MKTDVNHAEVYCQFDPLQEVWLGDCYPVEFYQGLKPEVRSAFSKITEITKHELAVIEQKLQSLGITVQRPQFTNNVDDYRDTSGNLLKPPICPRDDNMVLGKTVYNLRHQYANNPWKHVLDQYRSTGNTVHQAQFLEKYGYLVPPSIVRLGREILIDIDTHSASWELIERDIFPEWQEQFRIIACYTGGHADSVFCVLNPGTIITSHWKHNYEEFPGWEVYKLPKQKAPISKQYTDRAWWIENCDLTHEAFNHHIQTRAFDWVGNARETIFEVNSLMINESLIMTTGEPDKITKEWLAHKRIDYIATEFSARHFWDGGIHCLTVDTKRQGAPQDYFPERNKAIYYFSESG